jgi:hypothetical protein
VDIVQLDWLSEEGIVDRLIWLLATECLRSTPSGSTSPAAA